MDTFETWSAEPGAGLAEWFDSDRRGRLIVDHDLNLRWCNKAGRALLSGRGPLLLRDGVLRPRVKSEAARFGAFMRSATDQVSAYCMRTGEDLHHLVLVARALDSLPLTAVTAYFSGEAFLYAWADLCGAFGLTGVERETAQALAGGFTAEGIAQRTRTSVKTVRTHIRHVYSKLGVSSREELFHKLAPYMLTD